ncbi:MAG: TIGR01777 family oxidoreductase [Ferruginibacter sp.]
MQTILITGGTGLVGRELVNRLINKNYRVIILTRSLKNRVSAENISYALWDVKKGTIDPAAVKEADAVIHLAGAGVMDKKWSEAYKKEILESRTESSRLLVNTLQQTAHKVKIIVSASATGWYGPDNRDGYFLTETDPADPSFLGEVCRQWEHSIQPAENIGIRLCILRTGIVLAKSGGAYPEFKAPLKAGIAAILGGGKQTVSWIHIDDLCRAYIYAVENAALSGIYNAVAPVPVSNKTLTLTIANAVRGKFYIPVHIPVFILKLMMGARTIEILKSTRASAEKIKRAGFSFLFPEIDAAVHALENTGSKIGTHKAPAAPIHEQEQV